jgi:hypothetical protein
MTIHSRRYGARLILFSLLIGLWPWLDTQAQAISVRWFFFDPTVIRSDRSDPVVFKAQIEGSPSSVQLELAAGGTLNLSRGGRGLWSITLAAPQVLFGYQAEDANHNFVGFLDLFQAASGSCD